jgi:hypothetical protein
MRPSTYRATSTAEEVIAEDEDPHVLLAAIANVAKARGMTRVAEAAGLGRESVYKTVCALPPALSLCAPCRRVSLVEEGSTRTSVDGSGS